MKLVLALLMTSATVLMAEDSYTSQFDKIDFEETMRNPRMYKAYKDCLIGEGSCTPEGKELKEHLAEAIAEDCKKCTPKQKESLPKLMKMIFEKSPEDYGELEKVYDPKQKFRKQF